MPNPLVSDRNVDFLLYEVFDAEALCKLPAYADHSRETFDIILKNARKFAREVSSSDLQGDGRRAGAHGRRRHPRPPADEAGLPQAGRAGATAATRPYDVGGQQLPHTLATLSALYGMAANLSAVSYLGLTAGAAHLVEVFGSATLRETMMTPMYTGRWTGTMALTEPQAGSSLTDVKTRATPAPGGHYLVSGNKVFISGGDQDITENIVHLTLARIDGAPPGSKGVSLFAIPKRRSDGGKLVPNDVHCAGAFHKMGWRGVPSIALNFGERGDCHGWLVGEPHKGISYMFQMMNEARLMVGMNAIATASVAYFEALEYARTEGCRGAWSPRRPEDAQVPLVEHARRAPDAAAAASSSKAPCRSACRRPATPTSRRTRRRPRRSGAPSSSST